METIKVLLAHADRRVNNQVEVALLDLCFERALVRSTRTARLDDFARRGSIWDFDLMVISAHSLYLDRNHNQWAEPEEVAKAIRAVRAQRSAPIVALVMGPEFQDPLFEAGADAVLGLPLNSEQLKSTVRSLLHLGEPAETGRMGGWLALASFFRGFQRAKAID